MKEATLKAALEECQRSSTSQLSFANKTIMLHLDSVPSEHTHNDYISGNGQMPRDSQPNANLGTEIVKEEFVIEECYCPAAIKKEQNGDGDIITPIVDANPDTAISKAKFATKFEPNSLMTEECLSAVEMSIKRMKQKETSSKRKSAVNSRIEKAIETCQESAEICGKYRTLS